ncbi:uncharacterized protein PSFLO_03065 [Pseudozyma flocculosa]|uniref:Uncharacterized protein n=1 Tax=Pseudozyma flocculosa TaxID=84751 RepID=A0A5C3F0I8_9BASI|nr:uncharacterized protein PSFLO_03065 [Pseudozyma flocculosa]
MARVQALVRGKSMRPIKLVCSSPHDTATAGMWDRSIFLPQQRPQPPFVRIVSTGPQQRERRATCYQEPASQWAFASGPSRGVLQSMADPVGPIRAAAAAAAVSASS